MLSLSSRDFLSLVNHSHPESVSLFIPTDPLNADPRVNQIAFKNAVNHMIDQLKDLKLTAETYDSLNQKCEELLDDDRFWKDQAQGFAVLAAGNLVKTFKLPFPQPALTMISDHFYILPFIPVNALKSTYYILELDKEHTQLFRATATTVEKVTVPDLPESMEEVVGVEGNERQLHFHTGSDAPGGGKRPAMYHGNSSWKDDKDRYLERFLHAVDKALTVFLQQPSQAQIPLILSGVEESVVKFRGISDYPGLSEITLTKQPNPSVREEHILQTIKTLMMANLAEQQSIAVANFEEEPHPERKITVLAEVIRQAYLGKVGHLLVAEEAQVWGTFAPDTLSVIVEDNQQPMSAELVNLAARLTLVNNGTVMTMPREQLPTDSEVAAILRY